MADRKYASDYVLEEHLLPDGKVQTHRIYRGAYYRFCGGDPKALGKRMLLASAAIVILLIPLLFNNSRIGKTAYVLFPMAFTLVPVYQLCMIGWRLRTWEFPLTRQQRDQTEGRMKPTLVWLALLLGINTIGCGWYWLRHGLEKGEILCVLGVTLACALAARLQSWRNLAKMEECE